MTRIPRSPTAGRRLLRIRLSLLLVVIVVAIGYSLRINLGQSQGSTTSSEVRFNGSEHEALIRIEGGGNPRLGWTELTIEVDPGAWSVGLVPSYGWRCVAFDPPFHMKFRRADGTLTEPLLVSWPSSHLALGQWSEDGRSLVIDSGVGSEWPALQLGKHWYVGGAIMSVCWSIVAALPAICFAVLLIWGISSLFWRPLGQYECPGCGYDLRAHANSGCPECGWGREADETE